MNRLMFGRRKIVTSITSVNRSNLLEVLRKAINVHTMNQSEIDYLYEYYKGNQPILQRTKIVRQDVCNKIVENRANEIVSFKVGYQCGEPILYVGKRSDEDLSESITRLNNYMDYVNKSSHDQQLCEWGMIAGTSYHLVIPNKDFNGTGCPFKLFTTDPRYTFIVYSSRLGNEPLMGVTYYTDDEFVNHYTIYTDKEYFEVSGDMIVNQIPHALGCVPFYEYAGNNAMLGSFEIVLPLLDTMNNIVSNRMDGVEQQVQAFMKFINCDITKEQYLEFLELGAIKVNSSDGKNSDVDFVSTEINQTEIQTLKEDCYNSILTICGMPNRNGGTSTSDTGAAVVLRDGWSLAESRAKDYEKIFKKSEKEMLKLILRICSDVADLDISIDDIEIQFTRRNYSDILTKSQVLTTMLSNEKIHPLLAFQHSDMFPDPESAYAMSAKYYDEQLSKWEPVEVEETNEETDV